MSVKLSKCDKIAASFFTAIVVVSLSGLALGGRSMALKPPSPIGSCVGAQKENRLDGPLGGGATVAAASLNNGAAVSNTTTDTNQIDPQWVEAGAGFGSFVVAIALCFVGLSTLRLTNRQLIIANRPRLRVRNIVIEPLFTKGSTVKGRFYVSNIGGTRAEVVESHCEFLWNVNGLPMKLPYEERDGNNPIPPERRIIEGNVAVHGEFSTGDIKAGHAYQVYPNDSELPGTPGAPRAFFMGWIDYRDENGVKRRTAFCREFLQREGTARFYPVIDPDYDYEE